MGRLVVMSVCIGLLMWLVVVSVQNLWEGEQARQDQMDKVLTGAYRRGGTR